MAGREAFKWGDTAGFLSAAQLPPKSPCCAHGECLLCHRKQIDFSIQLWRKAIATQGRRSLGCFKMILVVATQLSTVAHICNAIIWDVEGGGGPGVQIILSNRVIFKATPKLVNL